MASLFHVPCTIFTTLQRHGTFVLCTCTSPPATRTSPPGSRGKHFHASAGVGSQVRTQGMFCMHVCSAVFVCMYCTCLQAVLDVLTSCDGRLLCSTDCLTFLCRVARIDKVLMSHMRVSWYGKHNGRWTLARHVAGPDEGQVRTGDVAISDQILAVFDRFTGNKEVPAEIIISAVAQLASFEPTATARAGDQENRILACV